MILLVIGLYLLFVLIKSWNDSIYIKRDKVIPTHTLEWGMIAITAAISGVAYSTHFWSSVAFDFLLVPITWIVQDIMLNLFLVSVTQVFIHIGGGYWDERFKDWFGHQAVTAMWSAKILLLIISIITFIILT